MSCDTWWHRPSCPRGVCPWTLCAPFWQCLGFLKHPQARRPPHTGREPVTLWPQAQIPGKKIKFFRAYQPRIVTCRAVPVSFLHHQRLPVNQPTDAAVQAMLGVGRSQVCLMGNPQDRHGIESWAAAADLCVCQTLTKTEPKHKSHFDLKLHDHHLQCISISGTTTTMLKILLWTLYLNCFIFKWSVVVIPSINSRWRCSSQNTIMPMRYQNLHSQEKHTNPHAYLRVHCVAFKYNSADLNTGCYSVKLQGGQSNRHLQVWQ